MLLYLLFHGTNCVVKKSKKCVTSEWIGLKEEDASLIYFAEDVDDFSRCLKMCSSYDNCKTINYSSVNRTCELREEMDDGELLLLL